MVARDTDWLLEDLLDAVSKNKAEVAITVFCGGLTVSGMAVSEEAYFALLGPAFGSLSDHATRTRNETEHKVEELAERAQQPGVSPEELESLAEEAERLRRRYIVMRDVTVVGCGVQELRMPAWRGRLSQVSGWALGSITLGQGASGQAAGLP